MATSDGWLQRRGESVSARRLSSWQGPARIFARPVRFRLEVVCGTTAGIPAGESMLAERRGLGGVAGTCG